MLSARRLPVQRVRWLVSTTNLLNASKGTLCSPHVTSVWCMPFLSAPTLRRRSRLLRCRASPNVRSPGTTIGCVTENENRMRILARTDYTPRQVDPSQTSLCLDPAVIATGFENDGQNNVTSSGQGSHLASSSPLDPHTSSTFTVRSQTSSNNWINFCKTVDKPLTNGTQIPGTRAVLSHPIRSPC